MQFIRIIKSTGVALYPTCDLGFDLALHLQRVDEDAAVPDEAGAGDASVRLAESLFINIIPVTDRKQNKESAHVQKEVQQKFLCCSTKRHH